MHVFWNITGNVTDNYIYYIILFENKKLLSKNKTDKQSILFENLKPCTKYKIELNLNEENSTKSTAKEFETSFAGISKIFHSDVFHL